MRLSGVSLFASAELAWTSFDKPSKIFYYSVRKNRNKIHPTQKTRATLRVGFKNVCKTRG